MRGDRKAGAANDRARMQPVIFEVCFKLTCIRAVQDEFLLVAREQSVSERSGANRDEFLVLALRQHYFQATIVIQWFDRR